MKRVVVTGMAGITSLGETADEIFAKFHAGQSGIRYMPEWEIYEDRINEQTTHKQKEDLYGTEIL